MKKIVFLILCFLGMRLFSYEIGQNYSIELNGDLHRFELKENGVYTIFELFLDDDIIGFIEIRPCLVNNSYISQLNVTGRFREYKYGALLLNLVFKHLRSKGINEVSLMASPYELVSGSDEYNQRQEFLFKYYAKFDFVLQSDGFSMVKQLRSKL
ncbi:MAG: GNAT family N-acetyltransferase [Candidatus Babeliales bacterium]|nr:GNAT family N-acetyltransferase [Candidatus Babeliales bacterium]